MPRSRSERPAAPALIVLFAVFVGSFIALYVLALGVEPGFRADHDALAAQAATRLGVLGPLRDLLDTISIGSLALATLGTVAIGLWRGRPDIAVAVVVMLVGANATTQVLKEVLFSADPLALEGEREFPGAFPSGHATAAASVGLAAVTAVGAGLRRSTATLAVLYAVAVGIATVALGWHYPSDVVGGFLVAGAWAAGVAGVLGLRARGPWVASARGFVAPGLIALIAFATAVAALAADATPGVSGLVHDNTSFIVGSTLIAAAGALVIVAVATQLDARADL
jgi:membrane-associated phospholipid phosphatase